MGIEQMKKLIKKLCDWWNEEEALGCPDPEMHDRNNENYDVLLTALNHGIDTNVGTIN